MKNKSMRNLIVLFFCSHCFLLGCLSLQSKNQVRKTGLQGEFVSLHKQGEIHNHWGLFKKIAIASGGKYSSVIAEKVYQKSGNIIDAAVALSFALAVERPHSTGIGGGGFLMLKLKDLQQPIVFDFRETAPALSHETMYQDKDGNVIERFSLDGVRSVAVPGMVAGLIDIHLEYGSLPLKEILAPVIKLAAEGFLIYESLANAIVKRADVLSRHDYKNVFFTADGQPRKEGELLKQPQLALTLGLIAQKGKEGFYQGQVAQAIIDKVETFGGILKQSDLNHYQVIKTQPVSGLFQGHKIYSMPLPSSGGVTLIQILNTIASYNLAEHPFQSVGWVHGLSSAMQLAYRDRYQFLGDKPGMNIDKLISSDYGVSQAKKITSRKALNLPIITTDLKSLESNETTNFSMIDDEGNAVVSTQTINWLFGSGVIISDYGIILNNEMDDFTSKVGEPNVFGLLGGKHNTIAPGKRPLSSMTPTIVLDKNDQVIMGLGSPAGSRIINCIAQALINTFQEKASLYEAISAVRIHHQWRPDQLLIEPPGLDEQVEKELKSLGHKIDHKSLGCRVSAVYKDQRAIEAVADPRDYGGVAGH